MYLLQVVWWIKMLMNEWTNMLNGAGPSCAHRKFTCISFITQGSALESKIKTSRNNENHWRKNGNLFGGRTWSNFDVTFVFTNLSIITLQSIGFPSSYPGKKPTVRRVAILRMLWKGTGGKNKRWEKICFMTRLHARTISIRLPSSNVNVWF